MAALIVNEGDFQLWVMERFKNAGGHPQDHRFSQQPHVPDMSAALMGHDFWLELKYGYFRLPNHPGAKYDVFKFREMRRGQLEWLAARARAGNSVCGVLGYVTTGKTTNYIFYMNAASYLEAIWQKDISAGAIILSRYCKKADDVRTGPHLRKFILQADALRLSNDGGLPPVV